MWANQTGLQSKCVLGGAPSLQRLAVGVISLLTFRENNGYQGSTSGDTQPGMLEGQGALGTPLPSSQLGIELMILGYKESSDFQQSPEPTPRTHCGNRLCIPSGHPYLNAAAEPVGAQCLFPF